jgi:hypothetical protein
MLLHLRFLTLLQGLPAILVQHNMTQRVPEQAVFLVDLSFMLLDVVVVGKYLATDETREGF